MTASIAAGFSGIYINVPLGYAQITVGGTASSFQTFLSAASVPYSLSGNEHLAVIEVESISATIRYLDDGQTPTTTYGQPIANGSGISLSTNFSQVKMISTSGSATVNVSFYR